MKDKIYTIPVTDAYQTDCACPLCFLQDVLEKNALDYYLGPSLMEPDVRASTNESGFCKDHLQQMYDREINRLGLGLMLHTHVKDILDDIGNDMRGSAPAQGTFFKGRDKDYKKNLEALAERIDGRAASCMICKKIESTMERYMDVLFWMYFEQDGFQKLFESKTRYCLPHMADVLRGCAKYLSQNQAAVFLEKFADLQLGGMKKLEDELEWFTLKFDYRNQDKPWGESKDAVPHGISLLGGGSSFLTSV